jgi:stearoyl-CoA desaturase (delta-9 desaturase)
MTGKRTEFLARCLEAPAYGFERDGDFYAPRRSEILREFLARLNLARTRKAWLPVLAWAMVALLGAALVLFVALEWSWPLAALGLAYAMVVLGTHGTIYLHRYSTHRAFRFRNRFWMFLVRNLTIKIVPEETYVVSHHVHHRYVEQPGDPYNVHGGWLYCFLADVNHQMIARDLDAEDYGRVSRLVEHTGVHANTYQQYLRWGTIARPLPTLVQFAANWAFWYGAFWLMGGHGLALAIFGMSAIWAVGVRTFNFDGHGRGKDLRRDGIDFNRADLSVNQIWPGYVAGEWHNNHHLYPSGARSGFLPYQLDLAWQLIRALSWIGAVSSYRDYRADFLRDHHRRHAQACAVRGSARGRASVRARRLVAVEPERIAAAKNRTRHAKVPRPRHAPAGVRASAAPLEGTRGRDTTPDRGDQSPAIQEGLWPRERSATKNHP